MFSTQPTASGGEAHERMPAKARWESPERSEEKLYASKDRDVGPRLQKNLAEGLKLRAARCPPPVLRHQGTALASLSRSQTAGPREDHTQHRCEQRCEHRCERVPLTTWFQTVGLLALVPGAPEPRYHPLYSVGDQTWPPSRSSTAQPAPPPTRGVRSAFCASFEMWMDIWGLPQGLYLKK